MQSTSAIEEDKPLACASSQKYLVSETQPTELCTQLYEMYNKQRMCDIVLTLCDPVGSVDDGVSIGCHKVVLAAASVHFRKLFYGNHDDQDDHDDNVFTDDESIGSVTKNHSINEVEMSGLSEDCVRCLLSFIYTGRCAVDDNSVGTLWTAGEKLGLEKLVTLCKEYMIDGTNPCNAVSFLQIAHALSDSTLVEHIFTFIRSNFEAMFLNRQLHKLSLGWFASILTSSSTTVKSEDTVFYAVVDWIATHSHTDDADKRSLCNLIRYDDMSNDFLLDVVLDHPLMQAEPQAGYIRSILKSRCGQYIGRSTRNQGSHPNTGMYFLGKDKSLRLCSEQKLFEFHLDVLLVDKVPEWIDELSAVAKTSNCLYVLGSNFKKQENTNKLIYITDRGKARKFLFLCEINSTALYTIGNVLYAIGGKITENATTDAIYRCSYDGMDCTWQRVATMQHAVCNALVHQYQAMLYVLGGSCGGNSAKCSPYVQLYNPATSTVKPLASLPSPCSSRDCGVLVFENQLLVFTVSQLMAYDRATDSWTTTKYDKVGNKINTVVYRGQILGCVSARGKCLLKSYDLGANIWSDVDADISSCWLPKFFGTFVS